MSRNLHIPVNLFCSSLIKEVIAFGTSGWSAKIGGIIDPTDCSEPTPGADITRIGDLCVRPAYQH